MTIAIKFFKKTNRNKMLHMRRKIRVRKKIKGDFFCPRLTVFRSAKHIYIQAINDSNGYTIASASTIEKGFISNNYKGLKAALSVGVMLGERLKNKGILNVVFDRNGYSYTGRVAAVADGVRQVGFNF